MRTAALIHHPGGGSASDDELARAREILGATFELEVSVCCDRLCPADHARQALAKGHEILIASGGDGTVSSVASTLIGHPSAVLGILPRGTANSIGSVLGVPRELEAACAIIQGGHTRLIDTGRVDPVTDGPSAAQPAHAMILLATIGLHAEAVTDIDPERKRRYGALGYAIEEAERMLDPELFDVTVEANGHRETCAVNALTVANLAPAVNLLAQGPATVVEDDGLLDVTLVAIRGFADAIATSFHLATHALLGRAAERDNVGFFRTKEIRIETATPRRVMIDGEDATETPVIVRVVPESLRVLVPAPTT
jgi:diacylglycerol kinase family enzyme